MMKFIEKNGFIDRKVAVFGTYGSNAGMEVDLTAAVLKHKGAGSHHCKRKAFVLFGTGHPNQEDLDGVRKFAREMATLRGPLSCGRILHQPKRFRG